MIRDADIPQSQRVLNCSDTPKEMPRTRILLADNNVQVMDCEEEILSPEYEIVGKISDGNAICAEVERIAPDIIVLDISLGDCDGIHIANQLQYQGFSGSIIFSTVYEDLGFVTAAMAAGARGYVVKSQMASDLRLAVRAILSKRLFVSPSLQQS